MNSRFGKFTRLRTSDKQFLLRAWSLVLAIRVGLWTLRFRRLYPLMNDRSRRQPLTSCADVPVARIVWAVNVASRYVPRGRNCLCRALAAHWLLVRHGHQAVLRFGVARDDQQAFKAHAWVECDGAAVIGQRELDHFRPLDGTVA